MINMKSGVQLKGGYLGFNDFVLLVDTNLIQPIRINPWIELIWNVEGVTADKFQKSNPSSYRNSFE